MSTNTPSRVHHKLRPNGADDLLFQIDRSRFRLYNKNSDPAPIYREGLEEEISDDAEVENDSTEGHEFAYEKDLKNFSANNLDIIQPQLSLYQDGDISGLEFPVDNRYVDILAIDRNNDLVVIELKVSKGYDRALGQLLRYKAWIKQNLAEPNQKVKGLIFARHISEDLRLAVSEVNDIELFEYQLSISLKQIKK